MKSARHRKIVQLIRQKNITNQNQLVALLRESGFPSTQATLSRDLEELGAIKLRQEGKVVYAMPLEVASAPAGEALRRMLAESVLELESSGNLVVVKTPPGHAGMVAAGIDRASIEGIAGTVAGDDTIIVVCKQGVLPRRVERRLRAMVEAFPGIEPAARS